MLNSLVLIAALVFISPAFAEEQSARNIDSQQAESAALELPASSGLVARSFFEPRNEAHLNALATVDSEFRKSLSQETPN